MTLGDGVGTEVSDPGLRNILDARFRTNPEYELVLFDRLLPKQQEALRELTKDPDFYGVLTPREGSTRAVKSVCRETALLWLTLSHPGPLPAYIRGPDEAECNRAIARFVLDGVLEIFGDVRFVSGLEAYDLIYSERPGKKTRGATSRLAQQALEYAQELDVGDSGQLSARLYFYNRLPLSPRWRRRFPDHDAVARYLGVELGGTNRHLLEAHWENIKSSASWDSWSRWQARSARTPDPEAIKDYKLYLSPRPDFVREALPAVFKVLREIPTHHFKFGDDALGLLRPDKIIIYFWDFETLSEAAKQIAARLAGCPAQGVPFTADITEGSLLSWGIDPPPERFSLPWQERESWRLWLTNRLATALLVAKKAQTSCLEPWRFALERLRLDSVDTETWTPLESFGHAMFA
jgi:hypothetical protein